MKKYLQSIKNYWHLVEAFWACQKYHNPSKNLTVIGVTGTDGKTTTSNLIHYLLQTQGVKVGLVSTIDAKIGDKSVDTGFHVTSPNASDLQNILSEMVKEGMTHVVLEVTSHALDQHRFYGVHFDIAVLTNLSHEHLDYHSSMDSYAESKAKLFSKAKLSVLNHDDESFPLFEKQTKNFVTYGIKKKSSYQATPGELTDFGQEFKINGLKAQTNLLGKYNIYNILASVSVLTELKFPLESVLSKLPNFPQLSGRFELIKEGQPFLVIVDFAHTPNALSELLELVSDLRDKEVKKDNVKLSKDSKIIVVFGCAGERDALKRPLMGEIAVKLADLSIFTAEDPRRENLNQILEQMEAGARKAGGKENVNFASFPNRKEAILRALNIAKKGDIILVTGKGHEKTLAIGETEVPWSDSGVIKELIGKHYAHL